MDDHTFDKIQELISSINALYPSIAIDNLKQLRMYNALHDLKAHTELKTGRIITFKQQR